jgi:hypothetical protein
MTMLIAGLAARDHSIDLRPRKPDETPTSGASREPNAMLPARRPWVRLCQSGSITAFEVSGSSGTVALSPQSRDFRSGEMPTTATGRCTMSSACAGSAGTRSGSWCEAISRTALPGSERATKSHGAVLLARNKRALGPLDLFETEVGSWGLSPQRSRSTLCKNGTA